ncbi:undecaprenyl-diphosphate phosphatase [Bacillota bacterium LX-D]|nr:undecaprenyl-diphosphate phosphatase [Bacillota bacterium LX-D]
MSIIQAIILGIVQGLTEFLPISSSGHLVLLQKFFGITNSSLAFDVILHFGTLIAVIIFFWSDIMYIIRKPFGKLPVYLVIGTIPAVIAGLFLNDFFEKLFSSGQTLGLEFLATGAILWVAESLRSGHKGLKEITATDSLFIGVMQAIAILPAISRSGLTIAGSLFRGLDREFAARFSFLLSIPAILGATVLEGKKLATTGIPLDSILTLLLGALAAAVAGYIAIKFMLAILNKGSLKVFSYYVFALGFLIILDQLLFHFFF